MQYGDMFLPSVPLSEFNNESEIKISTITYSGRNTTTTFSARKLIAYWYEPRICLYLTNINWWSIIASLCELPIFLNTQLPFTAIFMNILIETSTSKPSSAIDTFYNFVKHSEQTQPQKAHVETLFPFVNYCQSWRTSHLR